ncbi:MAG: hypothetical protein ACJA13_000380 [Paraglaciecola sp.]
MADLTDKNDERYEYFDVLPQDQQSPTKENRLAVVNWIGNHLCAARGVIVPWAGAIRYSILVIAVYLLSKNPYIRAQAAIEKSQGERQTASLNAHHQPRLGWWEMAYLKALWDGVDNNETLSLQLKIDEQPAKTIEACSLVVANAAPFTTALAQDGGKPDVQDDKLDVTWLPPQSAFGDHIFSLSELGMPRPFGDVVEDHVDHSKVKKSIPPGCRFTVCDRR